LSGRLSSHAANSTCASTAELDTLAAGFEVGGEGHPDVTDNQWYSLVALIEQATQQLAN
jgi:hypothetical protein